MKFCLVIDRNGEEIVTATVHEPSPLTEQIERLVRHYEGDDILMAYTDDEMVRLPFSQIECVTVIDGKSYAINTEGHRLRLKRRLYELEQLLPSSFFRINKSSLANVKYIERFAATYSGGVNAVFHSGYTEYVSRRCFADIKRRLEQQ